MKNRSWIRALVLACAFLCGSSAAWAVWFAKNGAYVPAVLNAGAFVLTLAGTVYGVWWLADGWRK